MPGNEGYEMGLGTGIGCGRAFWGARGACCLFDCWRGVVGVERPCRSAASASTLGIGSS